MLKRAREQVCGQLRLISDGLAVKSETRIKKLFSNSNGGKSIRCCLMIRTTIRNGARQR